MKKITFKTLAFALLALTLISCGSSRKSSVGAYGSPSLKQTLLDELTFKIDYFSEDPTYGYAQENPIMVGGAKEGNGPLNERRFLNALTGPNGEEVNYSRDGSCCHFATKNSPFGDAGLLDIYSITYSGLKEPIKLYINMYDSDTLKVPVGFKLKYQKDVKPFVAQSLISPH